MAMTKFKGATVNTCGDLPKAGAATPDFALTQGDLSEAKPADFQGAPVILNIFPSVDTPVCAASVRRFNETAASLGNVKVLCISRDLPFAQARFCGAEGIENVVMLSEMRDRDFGKAYGLEIVDGPLAGLLARAVLVVDGEGKVTYVQLVEEIAEEPDYEAALEALKACM